MPLYLHMNLFQGDGNDKSISGLTHSSHSASPVNSLSIIHRFRGSISLLVSACYLFSLVLIRYLCKDILTHSWNMSYSSTHLRVYTYHISHIYAFHSSFPLLLHSYKTSHTHLHYFLYLIFIHHMHLFYNSSFCWR